MSLDDAQRAQTGQELRANFRISGLTPEQVETELGLDGFQLDATFDLAPEADPAVVWELRDYLAGVIEREGGEPHPYTYLTDDARSRAQTWFPRRRD